MGSRPSAKSRSKRRISPRNSSVHVRKTSAKSKHTKNRSTLALIGSSKKPGRKSRVRISEMRNLAYDLGLIFEVNRKRIDWAQFVRARSEEELRVALTNAYERAREKLLYKPDLLIDTLKDKSFPTRNQRAQEQFIVDSLAAKGKVSPRRSRDIIQRERSIRKRQGRILRREFYIECSCGYHGEAYRDCCPVCTAPIILDSTLALIR
jgi:hypothetical protein